jgi:hypothetical protein
MQPAGHAGVAGVVDHDGFEVGLAVGENRQQPSLEVGDPPMRDGYERDGSRRYRLVCGHRRLQRLELAPLCAVEDVPPSGAQPLADRVGGLKVLLAPTLNAFGQKLFGL